MTSWREPAGIELFDLPSPAGPLRVRALGRGPAVVLLHPLPGSSRLIVADMMALGARGFRVLAPDLPGFGRSLAQADTPARAGAILAAAFAPLGAIALAGPPGALPILRAWASATGLARLCATHGLDPAPIDAPVLAEDGAHLDAMWSWALRAAGGDGAWAQRWLAEAALTTASGWALARATAAADDAGVPPAVDNVADLDAPIRAGMAGATTIDRVFAPGRHGRVHVRLARPWAGPARPPLLCLHASPLSGKVFLPLLRRLGGSRLALAPDTPGFGDSDAPTAPVEIGDFAEAILEAVSDHVAEPLDLLGFHTGSMIAAELAARHPGRVRRIAMISAPLFTQEELAWLRTHYQPKPETRDGAHNRDRWRDFIAWRGPRQDLAAYAENHAEGMRGGPAYFWGHRAAFNHDFAARLGALDHEILVLNPADDLAEHTRRAAALMRRGRVLELPDQGHGMLESDTDRVAETLGRFFDAS